MIVYLAVLRKGINLKKLEALLNSKRIRLTAHYKTIGVVKIESEEPVSETEFHDYFISIEEDKDNLTL